MLTIVSAVNHSMSTAENRSQQSVPNHQSPLTRFAHDYLAGRLTIDQLDDAVEALRQQALLLGINPIGELQSWSRMINRCRDEWRFEKDPLSEIQFSAWLREQIATADRDF